MGPYCSLCNVTDGSRYYSGTDLECKECTATVARPLVTTGCVLVALLVLGLILWRVGSSNRYTWVEMTYVRGRLLFQSLSLRAKFKQLAGFYQICTQIPTVYQIDLPSSSSNMLEYLSMFNS